MIIVEARLRDAEPPRRSGYVTDRSPMVSTERPGSHVAGRALPALGSVASAPALIAAMVLPILAAAAPVLLRDGIVALTGGARMLARRKARTPSSPKRFWVAAEKIESLRWQMRSLQEMERWVQAAPE